VDAALRAEPEGLIDPMVSLVSFWNGDQPVAVLSYYANHPQSYYRLGIANPDYRALPVLSVNWLYHRPCIFISTEPEGTLLPENIMMVLRKPDHS